MKFITAALTAMLLIIAAAPPVYAAEAEENVTVAVRLEEGADSLAVKEGITAIDGDALIMADFNSLFSGFAVTLNADAAKKLAYWQGVEAVYISRGFERSSDEDIQTAEERARAAVSLNSGLNYRGEGMVAAVIDSSFDVSHEMFVLSDISTAKISREDIDAALKSGLNVSNYFTHVASRRETPYVNAKIPFAFDYCGMDTDVSDGGSHGTHVAGIIAANNAAGITAGFDGVAPEAQLLLMKVSADDSSVIAEYAVMYALDDAITLGADVVNMSFSSPAGTDETGYSTYDYAELVALAAEKGITVVCSAGNSNMVGESSNYDILYGIDKPLASNPDYGLVGNPSTLAGAFSAASVNGDYIVTDRYITLAGGENIAYNEPDIGADLTALGDGYIEYAAVGGKGSAEDIAKADLKGKAALIERGGITFIQKVLNAQNAGAAAVIIYDSAESGSFTMKLSAECVIPAVSISRADGLKMAGAASKKLKISGGTLTAFPAAGAGELSDFSSKGLTPSMTLKPEITAIGGSVYSCVPGGYGLSSGTSMSSPYVAGAALLVKQMLADKVEDQNDTFLIRRVLMSTAETVVSSSSEAEYSPRSQGAGLVDLEKALHCSVDASGSGLLSKIELGDGVGREFTMSFELNNRSDSDAQYELCASATSDKAEYISYKSENGAMTGEYFITGDSFPFKKAVITVNGGNTDVNRYKSGRTASVTVPANSSVTITVKVTIDSTSFKLQGVKFKNGFFAEGYIWLRSADSLHNDVSLPYVGFCGDWNDAPALEGAVNSRVGCFYTQRAVSYIETANGYLLYTAGCSAYISGDIVNPALVMISPNGDGCGDYIAVAARPLRNISSITVTVRAADGELVCEDSYSGHIVKAYYNDGSSDLTQYIMNFIWNGSDYLNYFYKMPDGEYILTLSYVTESGGEGEWSMTFYSDTVFPTLDKAWTERGKNGEKLLHVEISDDNALQYIVVYDAEGLKQTYAIPALEAESALTAVFDVSGAAGDYVYIDIVDYAMNVTTVRAEIG